MELNMWLSMQDRHGDESGVLLLACCAFLAFFVSVKRITQAVPVPMHDVRPLQCPESACQWKVIGSIQHTAEVDAGQASSGLSCEL